MVWVEGGTGTLGSRGHYPEEQPPVSVTVDGFWIDRYEVTNARFVEFVRATGYETSAERASETGLPVAGSAVFSTSNGGWSFVAGADWRHPEGSGSSIDGREDHPVVQVSLEDAKAFADWAGRQLPTEAQWEFAARAGLAGRGGHAPLSANTWQGVFPLNDEGRDGHVGRAPVGSFAADALGLHDMIGNVWEWTVSPYYPTHEPSEQMRARKEGFDPRQPGVAVAVVKGGSFLCSPDYCRRYRPAARYPQEPSLGTNHIGFRTICVDHDRAER